MIIGGDGPNLINLLQMREKFLLQDRIELLGPICHKNVLSICFWLFISLLFIFLVSTKRQRDNCIQVSITTTNDDAGRRDDEGQHLCDFFSMITYSPLKN